MDRLKKHLQDHLPEMDVDLPQKDLWPGIQQRIEPAQAKGMLLPMQMMRWVAAASVLAVVAIAALLVTQKKEGEAFVKNNFQPASLVKIQKENKQAEPNASIAIVQPKKQTKKKANNRLTWPIAKNNLQDVTAKAPKQKTKIAAVDSTQKIRNNFVHTEWNKVTTDFETILVAQKQRINRTPLLVEDPSYFDSFKQALQQLENDEKKLKKEMANGTEMNDQMLDQLIQINQQKLNLLKQLQAEINRMNERNKLKPKTENDKTSFVNI